MERKVWKLRIYWVEVLLSVIKVYCIVIVFKLDFFIRRRDR